MKLKKRSVNLKDRDDTARASLSFLHSYKGTILFVLLLIVALSSSGCKKRRDNPLDNEPVIPLVEHDSDFKNVAVGDNSVLSKNSQDSEGELNSEGTAGTDSWEKQEVFITSEDYPYLHLEGQYQEYELSGVQLTEDELKDFSRYFNDIDVNSHLCQIYMIPIDYDETLEISQVDITCVAGSYDTNGLYSIFYKKDGDNGLWNVMLRESNGEYVFHSNQKCSDR